MSEVRSADRKLFTLDEANATLPLVRAITEDLATLARDVFERRERLTLLQNRRKGDQSDPYTEELSQIEEELEKDAVRLREYVDELVALGVEPKGVEGLVDFPTMMDGRVVYLCWRLGEPEVLYWHEIDAGFAGRQQLTAGAASSPPSSGEKPDGSTTGDD